ncbi:MAG: hypothetical protein ACUVRK_04400, partial [Spirochaetota bacterium]
MAGIRSGYFAWQPFLKDIGDSGFSDITWGTGVLYGPIFSVMITDELTLSVSSLMGKQSTHWQSKFSYFVYDTRIVGNYYFESFRADVDSALSYRIGQYFKIFAGYKYQYLKFEYKYTKLNTDPTNNNKIKEITAGVADPTANHYYGPALGLGFTYPITDVYFFSMNISGLYMTGDIEYKDERISCDSNGNYVNLETNQLKVFMRQIGMNVEPVIGMNPGNNLPIITLGVRYQISRWQTAESNDATGD